MHANTRARWLLDEAKKLGGEITMEAMEDLAAHTYSGQMTYVERQELVATALDIYVAERRGEAPTKTPKEISMDPKQLTSEETRAHAIEFFKNNPRATSRACFEHLTTLGTPSVSESTFINNTASLIRREMRDVLKGKRPKKVFGAKKQAATKAAGVYLEPMPPCSTHEPAPQKASAPEVDETKTAAAEVVHPAAIADDDERDRIILETPGGKLTARDEGRGTWFAEFQGAIQTDLLNALVADLVGPFTAKREGVGA